MRFARTASPLIVPVSVAIALLLRSFHAMLRLPMLFPPCRSVTLAVTFPDDRVPLHRAADLEVVRPFHAVQLDTYFEPLRP